MNAKAKEVEGELVTGELALPEKEKGMLAELNKSDARIKKYEKEWKELPDMSTTEGMELARSRRRELVSMRTEGNANRKLITAPAREWVKKINDLWTTFSPRLEALERPYDDAIKAVEAEAERAKTEKREANQKRIDAIKDRIDTIKSAPLRCATIELIDAELKALNDTDSDLFADFEEFKDAAEIHIDTAKTALQNKRADMVKAEEEKQALDKQRQEQEAAAAKLKADQDKLAEQQAELDRQKQEQDDAAQKLKQENEARDAARKNAHVDAIELIESAAERCETAEQCLIELTKLEATHPDGFDEYSDKAEHAITNATMALNEKHRQLVLQEKQAETERLHDEAIIENVRREHEAEVTRQQEAIKPDIEKVQAWLTRLGKVKQPAGLESDKAASLVHRYADFMAELRTEVDAMDSELNKVA